MLKNGDHCTSPQSIDFAVMEVKEYDEIYNVVADQKYPDCITKCVCVCAYYYSDSQSMHDLQYIFSLQNDIAVLVIESQHRLSR